MPSGDAHRLTGLCTLHSHVDRWPWGLDRRPIGARNEYPAFPDTDAVPGPGAPPPLAETAGFGSVMKPLDEQWFASCRDLPRKRWRIRA